MDSDSDLDSDLIPVVGSYDSNLNLNLVKCEKFCKVQCSNLVCSLQSELESRSVSQSDSVNKPLRLIYIRAKVSLLPLGS